MLAACAVSPPDNTLTYRPGAGVVENVRAARVALPAAGSGTIAGSEAAGGSYGSPVERLLRPRWTEGYQLTLRMDDGSTQRVTQDSAAFQVGDRVQVTADGRIVKTAALAAPAPAATTAAPTTAAPITAAPIAPAPTTSAVKTYRPGAGVVESASVVSLSSSPSAAAGGTAASPTMAYRVKMADGTTQSVVQAGERFEVGDRVQITGDGRVIGP
jgi:outer membrane lipoprotein SlyB